MIEMVDYLNYCFGINKLGLRMINSTASLRETYLQHLTLVCLILGLIGCSSTNGAPKFCDDIVSCTSLVRLKLQSNLLLEESYKGNIVLIEFFLDDEANVFEYKISSTTGLRALEDAANTAVQNSSPFSELLVLPKSEFEQFKHIKLTIDPSFK